MRKGGEGEDKGKGKESKHFGGWGMVAGRQLGFWYEERKMLEVHVGTVNLKKKNAGKGTRITVLLRHMREEV